MFKKNGSGSGASTTAASKIFGIKRLATQKEIRSRKDEQKPSFRDRNIRSSYPNKHKSSIIMSPSVTEFLFCTAYLLSLCIALVWTQDCHCGLPGTIVKFKSCTKKPAAWRSHDHPDINLTGNCLPEVPVK